MIVTTKAIVLKHFKYSENSLICKIYTEEFGIKTYLINNVRSKKSQNKMAFYQPLSLLDMNVYNKENKQIQHVKEVSCAEPFITIHNNILKSSVAIFIAEILLKTIKEEEANPAQFAFVKHFILSFDNAREHFADYHLVFLLHLTQYLGFYPKIESYSVNAYFDMIEGKFLPHRPAHSTYIDKTLAYYFFCLLKAEYENTQDIKLNGNLRSKLLENIILYYRTHLEGIGNINSTEVLKMVFT